LLCLWLTACVLPIAPANADMGAAGLGDPIYPHLGNGGYEVTHYAITLAVDMASNTITGTTTIQAQALQPLRRFNLDFWGLAIDDIEVNDHVSRFQRTGGELTLTPSTPLASGQALTVTVAYHGQPQPITDDPAVPRSYGAIGWLRLTPGVFVISEPSAAMTWFPGNHHPSDKATYTFAITVAKPYVVAANGLLLDAIDHGATRTYVWAESRPMASYLATLAIAEFVVMTGEGPDGLPIRHYLPPSAPESLVEALRETPAMLRFFTELLGPYPFEAYGVAVIDDPQVQIGLEAQTLTILPVRRVASEQLHELAHQWLGNSVTPATWQDTWLNEGFATYCEWLWVERMQGEAAFDNLLRTQYTRMAQARMGPPALPPPDQLFAAPVYIRGAWSLHALRLGIGDDTFFALLREWVTRYRYSNASTADFIALAEEISGQSLADFFQLWLYDGAVPPLPALASRSETNPGSLSQQLGREGQQNLLQRLEDAQQVKHFSGKRRVVAADRVVFVFQHHEIPVTADHKGAIERMVVAVKRLSGQHGRQRLAGRITFRVKLALVLCEGKQGNFRFAVAGGNDAIRLTTQFNITLDAWNHGADLALGKEVEPIGLRKARQRQDRANKVQRKLLLVPGITIQNQQLLKAFHHPALLFRKRRLGLQPLIENLA
jgi:aminopeptidase N